MSTDKSPTTRPATLHAVVQTLALAGRVAPVQLSGLLGVSAVAACAPVAQVAVIERLVTNAATGGTGKVSILLVIGLAVLAAGTRLINEIAAQFSSSLGDEVTHAVSVRFLKHVADADASRFDDPKWQSQLTLVAEDLRFRPYQLVTAANSLLASVATLILLLAFLSLITPLLTLLALASAIPSVVVQRRVNAKTYEFIYGSTELEKEMTYSRKVVTDTSIAAEVRAYDAAERFSARYASFARTYLMAKREIYVKTVLSHAVSALAVGIIFFFAYQLTISANGPLAAGRVAALVAALGQVALQTSAAARQSAEVEQQAVFLTNYFTLLGTPGEGGSLDQQVDPIKATVAQVSQSGIYLDDVSFAYPARPERLVVHSVKVRLPWGTLVGIVGENGAGKTTILNLIQGIYRPTVGRILVDGVDISSLAAPEARAYFSVLFQDQARYELSVEDNVTVLADGATASDLELAYRTAGVERFIAELPDGDRTRLGKLFLGSVALSGGQWQRLAIARCLRRPAKIFIMDEPASALDPESEAELMKTLRADLDNRIGIVVSHRFSTVRGADMILVVNDGSIAEMGSHDELMQLGGRYAASYALQASAYQ